MNRLSLGSTVACTHTTIFNFSVLIEDLKLIRIQMPLSNALFVNMWTLHMVNRKCAWILSGTLCNPLSSFDRKICCVYKVADWAEQLNQLSFQQWANFMGHLSVGTDQLRLVWYKWTIIWNWGWSSKKLCAFKDRWCKRIWKESRRWIQLAS